MLKNRWASAICQQGLTLVHFSAQPKPFWSYLPVSPCPIDWGKFMHPAYPTKCAYVEPKSGRVRSPACQPDTGLVVTMEAAMMPVTVVPMLAPRVRGNMSSSWMRPTAATGVSVDVVMEEDCTMMVMNRPITRGLHSFPFRLNVSAFCEIGGAFRSSLGGL